MQRHAIEATVQAEAHVPHQGMAQTREAIAPMGHHQTEIVEPIEVVTLQEVHHATIPGTEAHGVIRAGLHQAAEHIAVLAVEPEVVGAIEVLEAEVLGVRVAIEAQVAEVQEAQVAIEVQEEVVPLPEGLPEEEAEEEEDKFPKTLSTKKNIQNEEIINFHNSIVMHFCKCPEH